MWHRVLRGAVALRQPLVSELALLPTMIPSALAVALPSLQSVGSSRGYATNSENRPNAPGDGPPEQGPEEERGRAPADTSSSPYLEQLKRLKGSTSLEKQTLGGPEPPLWQQAITGALGRLLQSWASDFMRARIDRRFDAEEFLEGSKDAFWMGERGAGRAGASRRWLPVASEALSCWGGRGCCCCALPCPCLAAPAS